MNPPSPLNPPRGQIRVRGQNARKAPSPPLTPFRVRGIGGHRCGKFPEKSYPQKGEQVLT